MDRLKRNFLLFLILAISLGLAITFRSSLVSNVFVPAAILLWAAWRILASVNQNLYWMVVIIACALLVSRLIPSRKLHTPSLAYNYKHRFPNRVEYWRTLLKDSALGTDETENLRENMKTLLESAIAQGRRSNPTELEKLIETGTIPSSRETRDFLFPPKEMNGISFIPKRFRRWARNFTRQDITSMDEILERMENEMEIPHEP